VKISLARDVTITPIEEGAVLLDGRRGRYWQVNGSGAMALRALLDGESLEAIAARLSATAPVASEKVMADVEALISALSAASLVDVV
jgi:Coenzyme PQQ synthesis protein D (PqqD)